MSDSGTVELSRDCGEEGTRHMSCRGKEDRDTILNDLTCIDEVDAADNSLKATTESIPSLLDVHQKSVELIRKVITHNLEDNHIDMAVNKIDDSPSSTHIEEKLNLDEVMLADQPASDDTTADVLDVKPTKKSIKKIDEKYLKKSMKKKFSKKINNDEEFMLGDQPIEDRLSKSIADEILPHAKKSLPQDLKHKIMTTENIVSTAAAQFVPIEVVSTTLASVITSSTETRPRRETEMPSTNAEPHTTVEPIVTQTPTVHIEGGSEEPISTASGSAVTTTSAHLPKIAKKSFNSHQSRHRDIDFGTTPHHLRDKSDVDSTNDHFIPPMLLVRTKFSSTRPHTDETTAIEHHTTIHHGSTGTLVSEPAVTSTQVPPQSTSDQTVEITSAKSVTDEPLVTTTTILETTDATNIEIMTTHEPHAEIILSSTIVPSTIVPPTTKHLEVTEHVIQSSTHAPSFRQPHAPRYTTSTTTSAPELITSSTTTPSQPPTHTVSIHSTPITDDDKTVEVKTTDVTTETILVTTNLSTSPTTIVTGEAENATTTVVAQTTEKVEAASSTTTSKTITEKVEMPEEQVLSSTIATLSVIEDLSSGEDTANHSDFTNAENYQPYRPNRRRSLTKPEVHTYIKKILG